MKFAKLSLFLLLGASVAGAATLTVSPGGQYPTVCSAVEAAVSGDTILIDANHGVPYIAPADPQHSDGRSDCQVKNTQNNITIRGINGRPILDAGTGLIEKGILVLDGHDVVVDNLELRNANDVNNPDSSSNAAGIRIEDGSNAAPSGGNITINRCYIHDNGDGILSGNSGPNGGGQWFSATPFLTFTNDQFNNNGDGSGQTHNMYIGFDGFLTMKFTLQNSISTNAFVGHTVKTRAPYNYILNNIIGDSTGNTSYILDFPLGGTSYVTGNLIYKSVAGPDANYNLMIYADVHDNAASDPEYAVPHQDLHFQNNIVIDNNLNNSEAFVNISCDDPSNASCPVPTNGPPVTTPAVVSSNLFIGQDKKATNQPDAITKFNLILPFSPTAGAGYGVAVH